MSFITFCSVVLRGRCHCRGRGRGRSRSRGRGVNDAWRLCGDEDDVRVSWLGRFTHVLLRGLAIVLVWFGVFWLLFCLVVWSVAVLLCVAVLCLVFVCCLFLCFLVCCFYSQITAFLFVGSRNYPLVFC